ncbi:hypothetical protein BHE74_00026257 [Ensete ventricosum]|nr:hypothetical protein GW17_00008985 [Ensete ventricosum]RWW66379.1 hypothetical protein BHE74_00026257 [Ensete ventricosum]
MGLTICLGVPQLKQQNTGSESYGGRSEDGHWTFAMCLDSHKNHEDHRRASSYHSFSQSPPEDQYEERYSGKKPAFLSRKPGSDRGLYEGKISSFLYSPGHQGKQSYEDKSANETPNSRNSDYSVASVGDSSKFDSQSPNFQDTGCNSPPLRQVRDILIEDTRPPVLTTYPDANVKKNLNGLPHPQNVLCLSCKALEIKVHLIGPYWRAEFILVPVLCVPLGIASFSCRERRRHLLSCGETRRCLVLARGRRRRLVPRGETRCRLVSVQETPVLMVPHGETRRRLVFARETLVLTVPHGSGRSMYQYPVGPGGNGNTLERKSTNPFDSDLDANDLVCSNHKLS